MESHPVPGGPDDVVCDVWDYFGSIPNEDIEGHDFTAPTLGYVWTMPTTGFQHVLVASQTPNVFLVLVVDLRQREVRGHHLLDLRKLYGLI